MAETTMPTATVPSQKRPLEEPSSESGPGDQPEAKRPALDSLVREDNSNGDAVKQDISTDVGDALELKTKKELAEDQVAGNGTAEPTAAENGVASSSAAVALTPAGVPDTKEAADVLETQPIQSTTTANGVASTQSNFSAQPQDESGWLHIRAIISSAEAATVIGKGGENVTLIRRMSGAKCTVSDYSRGAVERILTVSGLNDAIAKAFGLIIRTLNNESLTEPSDAQSKTYPLRLLIPHVLIGSIIGQKGVRIREIQDLSGARLNASDSPLPCSSERSLVVLGVADAVHIATYYVGGTLIEQLTERFGGPAASAYATRSGGPAGAVPGGLQVIPYTPQPIGGSWGHPDTFRRHPTQQAAQRPQPSPYTPQYGGPQMAQPPVAHPQAPISYNAGSPRNYTGAGPHLPQPYPQHGQPPMHHGPPQQAMGAGMPGQAVTQQIYIPNDMVGAIIGKGGAKINEIRQLSGSVIKINEPQDNSNERLVTITGTQECNSMALYMLYQRLESEKHRI